MLIIILLAILSGWLYEPIYSIQYNWIVYLNRYIDILRIKINTHNYLRKYLKYFPRWLFILTFIVLIWIIYIYLKKIHYILDYIICLLCINIPLQPPWQVDISHTKTLFSAWRELFISAGKGMIEQNINALPKHINNNDYVKSANLELCAKSILNMWCYGFFLPLICMMLPYGTMLAISWILIRYTLIQYEKFLYIYILEYIPMHIILLISAMLGNFESCISAARQAKKSQKNHINYYSQYNNWLFNSIKGSINLDVIISNYHYQQFLTFIAKLVLAIILLYSFTFFI